MNKLFIIILAASFLQTNNALSLCRMFCGKSNEGELAQRAYYDECLRKHPHTPRINRLHRELLEVASKHTEGHEHNDAKEILKAQMDLREERDNDCANATIKYFADDISSLT